MGSILTQTGGTSATGDLTVAIGNDRLAILCAATNGTISTAIVSSVILDAEAETLSILGPGFDVTATSVYTARVVKLYCKDIAVYRCYCRVTEFRNEKGDPVTKPEYDNAIEGLTKIASGMRDLGNEASTGKSAVAGGTFRYGATPFILDPNETTSGGVTGGF